MATESAKGSWEVTHKIAKINYAGQESKRFLQP